MATKTCGKRSFNLEHPPIITHWASVAGKLESKGPLGSAFDKTCADPYFGEKTWEQGEKRLQQITLRTLLRKARLEPKDIGLVLSGDLLNQCIGSSFSLRNTGIAHLGLYGACSTMAESLLIGSMVVDGGFADRVIAQTSSHFASSERQYRFPLGYGGQRPPTAQWTATGSGAALLCSRGSGPRIECCTPGVVTDLGVTDANNMGAAMAPAAWETIRTHLEDFGRKPTDYDRIFTGDLGQFGRQMLLALAQKDGVQLEPVLEDCGCMVFDNTVQDVHSGGSGCGCSAIALCSVILDRVNRGVWKRVLFCGTGALLSPTSTQQGLPIPGICHAVCITGGS